MDPGSYRRCRRLLVVLVGVSFICLSLSCDRRDSVETEPPQAIEDEALEEEAGVLQEESGPYDGPADAARQRPVDLGPPSPAIYFIAGLKGYTEPCGCTADVLLGGIDRLTAFVEDGMKLHQAAVFIDGGDWLFEFEELEEHMKPQERAKAQVLAAAHAEVGTLFSVPGPRDLALGVAFYQEMMAKAQMEALAVNLRIDGKDLAGTQRVELGSEARVLFVGAVDPANFEAIDGVEVSDDVAAIQRVVAEADEADVVVLVYQGTADRAEEMASAVDGVDFVIVGHDPRLRDIPQAVDGAFLLDSYDQGRYVGRLKLYDTKAEGVFVDGRASVVEERQGLQEQIEYVEQNLRILEVRTGGEPNAMTQRLEARLSGLEQQMQALERESIDLPEGRRAFLFDTFGLEPGYRLHPGLERLRREYNQSLAELNSQLQREVIPVEDGEPFYVGTPQCASCHIEAHQFWEETSHSTAVATLEERDKAFDQSCIGCHVVGWEEPGGSMLGNLVYEAELDGRTFEKDLRNVGCESCHGPGSLHRQMPIDAAGQAQHILARPTETQCMSCHVEEHSPRFDFDVYVEQITGEGHAYQGAR